MSRTRSSRKRNAHLKWIRLIHSYSAMAVLISMLFFAITGLTLNHRDWFPANEQMDVIELALPEEIFSRDHQTFQPLSESALLQRWLEKAQGVEGSQIRVDWNEEEALLTLDVKKPGGYSLVEVDVASRKVLLEKYQYGLVATLNDLHMGRNSGKLWSWFIDLSSVAMLLFSLTGLWLVLPQKSRKNKLFGAGLAGGIVMLGFFLLSY